MNIKEMIMVNQRDKKILGLYQILSKSDFNGNYEDAYVIEILFATLCLDVLNNSKTRLKLKAEDYINLAKELVRTVETDDGIDNYSVWNWGQAMLNYMLENKLKVKDVAKMSTIDLKNELGKLLDKGE